MVVTIFVAGSGFDHNIAYTVNCVLIAKTKIQQKVKHVAGPFNMLQIAAGYP